MITEERVRYVETDKMSVVHHSVYFHWFEVGRTELMRSLGMSYKEMEESGVIIPVIEAHCKYIAPAEYDDIILIKTEIKNKSRVTITFDYQITKKKNNKVLVKGWTKHTFINQEGKIIELPKDFLKQIKKHEK